MLRILPAALAFGFLLSACSSKQKYYIHTDVKRSDLSGAYHNATDIDSIYAESDSAAFWSGAFDYVTSLKANQLFREKDVEPPTIPLKYSVYNTKGEDIGAKLPKETLDQVFEYITKAINGIEEAAKPDSTTLEQQQIAFGDLRFGMTQSEVRKIPAFQYGFTSEQLGQESYRISPAYDNNGKLYFVEIEGAYETANFLDTRVKDQIDNLIEVITAKYGAPEFLDTYPSIFDYEPGYNRWMRQWRVGTKVIYVGSGEEHDGARYNGVCWIYDKNLHKAQTEARKKEESAQTDKDAGRF